MPGFDGTGPRGRGPMTGRGMGFCVLWESNSVPAGLAGVQGRPVGDINVEQKEVINMPRGDGTGPVGSGPMTGRAAGFCAGYPVPGYMNPAGARGYVPAGAPAGQPAYGYGGGSRYGGATPGPGFGRGFGRARRFRGGFGRW